MRGESTRTAPLVTVLGETQLASAEGTAIPLSATQRRMLARLALSPRYPVTLAALAEAVWGADVPTTSRAALQNQISRLRQLAGADLVATRGESYLLHADVDVTALRDDARRAEELLVAGRIEAAREHAERAAAAEGRPFADLPDIPEVDAARGAVEAARRTARDLLVEIALDQGRLGWAVAEAEAAAAETPWDEARAARRVRALAQAGRRGDALAALGATRRELRHGLGIDIGPELADLERRLFGRAVPPVLAEPAALVGRDALLDEVVARIAAGRDVALTGEPGSGVSRMLRELAARLAHPEIRIVAVRCGDHPEGPSAVLAEILAELQSPPVAGLGVLAGFSAAVSRAAEERRVLLVVDDIHLLGPSSREALTTAAEDARVTLLAGGHGEDGDLAVPPLDAASTLELARGAGLATDDAALVHAATGGIPLYVLALAAEPELAHERLTEGEGGPSSVLTALVLARLDRLGSAARAVVDVLAVAGPRVPLTVLGDLAPAGVVDGLLLEGLVERTRTGALAFRRGADAQVVYLAIPAERRAELHHAVGRAARAKGLESATAAAHLDRAAHLDPGGAVAAHRAAAIESRAAGRHADSVVTLRRAVELLERSDASERDRIPALVELGDALRLVGDPAHRDLLVDACVRAERLDDVELFGRAAFALLQLGASSPSGQVDAEISAIAERAIGRTAGHPVSALVRAAASLSWSMSGDAGYSTRLFDEAEAAADDSASRRAVLPFAYLALGHPSQLARRGAVAAELAELAEEADDDLARWEAAHLAASTALQRADGAAARGHHRELLTLTERVGDVGRRWSALYLGATIAHLDGDITGCLELTARALAIFEPVSPSRARAVAQSQQLVLAITTDRVADLAAAVPDLASAQPGVPAWSAAAALAVADSRPDDATRLAADVLDAVPLDFTWSAALVVGARAVHRLGDADLARRYRDALAPWSGQVSWQGSCVFGPIDSALAHLEDTLGNRIAAVSFARSAAQQLSSLEAPAFLSELDPLLNARS